MDQMVPGKATSIEVMLDVSFLFCVFILWGLVGSAYLEYSRAVYRCQFSLLGQMHVYHSTSSLLTKDYRFVDCDPLSTHSTLISYHIIAASHEGNKGDCTL